GQCVFRNSFQRRLVLEGDDHHVPVGVGESIQDDKVALRPMHDVGGAIVRVLRGGAEYAALRLIRSGDVIVTPGGPEVVHDQEWGAESGAAGGALPPGGPPELFTTSLSSLLGLKYGIFLAGTSTRAPVLGLRPIRGWRWRVRKLPNPRISILSPERRERTILSKIASTMTSDSFRVISTTRETSSIRSALVIAFSSRVYLGRETAVS